jgi:hypothetical protein
MFCHVALFNEDIFQGNINKVQMQCMQWRWKQDVSRMGHYFLTRGLAIALEAFLLPTTTGSLFHLPLHVDALISPSLFLIYRESLDGCYSVLLPIDFNMVN